MEQEKEVSETRIFSDPTIPSFFEADKRPFQMHAQKNLRSGQVEFSVCGRGVEIDAALNDLYANKPVGALDFIKALKSFRSSIFALKGGRNG